jgi:hypothetical protein
LKSGKHSSVFLIEAFGIENDEEIDRPKFPIDHRRPAHLRTDSQVHIEKCRQLDFVITGVVTGEPDRVPAREYSYMLVEVSVANDSTVSISGCLFILREDRTAAEEVSFVLVGEIRDQRFPQ